MTHTDIVEISCGNLFELGAIKVAQMPRKDASNLGRQLLNGLVRFNIIFNVAIRKPVQCRTIVDNISTEEISILLVEESNASPRVTWKMQHS